MPSDPPHKWTQEDRKKAVDGNARRRAAADKALRELESLRVEDEAGRTLQEVCKTMEYHPVLEVVSLLKGNKKTGGLTAAKRLDANLKLMEYFLPKMKSVDPGAGPTEFQVEVNDGQVEEAAPEGGKDGD